MRRNGKGFTLTELLVVLAILALIASLAVPTSSRMMAIGRQTVCANQLSQLMRMVVSAQTLSRAMGKLRPEETPFMEDLYWPQRVAAEYQGSPKEAQGLFQCPDGLTQFAMGRPPIEYLSAINWEFMPFNPESFHCCSREGVDEKGKSYTEYCIEENPDVESRWSHAGCPCEASHWGAHPEWSTNDGIWRVYDELEDGMRTVILTYYDCGWPNQLWINGEFYADNLATKVGLTLKFRDVYTNYGYNTLLGSDHHVEPDTVVLMDFDGLHIDPDAVNVIDKLADMKTARHLGKINVLTADGAVNTISPADLYPDLNMRRWTPAAD
jgi:prepilin-type N-terminal cleavage/methylation domain-containing protein